MEKQGLKSGYLIAHKYIQRAVAKAFNLNIDATSITLLLNDKKGDYQTAFGNMLFNKFKATNEEIKKFENPTKLMEHMKTIMDDIQDPVFDPVVVNDKAFMFLSFNRSYLEEVAKHILSNGLHVESTNGTIKIAIDFSSPNVAKEMHVGHLRSTIIGESICRVMEFMGHTVHRINHLGDWGTQFGMLITNLFDEYPEFLVTPPDIRDLETFYVSAKKRFDVDEEFKKRSQEAVVKLQGGDAQSLKAWQMICDVSRGFFSKIYSRLDITNNEFGESFYNPMLPSVLKELEDKGLIKVDKGAKCLYVPKKEVPLMVQKSDGGYGYDTTDLAASKYRLQTLGVDRVIILTDVGQFPHFDLIYKASYMAGWAVEGKHRLDHMGFGLVTGEDGGKIKTRTGGSAKLMDLLDEAKENARLKILERLKGAGDEEKEEKQDLQTKLNEEQIDHAAEIMGIDAVKYYDLSQNRTQNYKFSYDRMLNTKGNTAVYLLYSYARINSIIEKSGFTTEQLSSVSMVKITDDTEVVILAHIAKFAEVLLGVSDELNLNRLCAYLYELSVIIATGYNKYKILGNEHTLHRVQILMIVRVVFDKCFYLLGLKTLEKI